VCAGAARGPSFGRVAAGIARGLAWGLQAPFRGERGKEWM